MFRHERPQRLRLRQFTQLGTELLHDDSVHADVEVISLARKFLDAIALNTPSPKLLLNTLGRKRDRERFNAALQDWLRPRVSQLSEVSRARFASGNCLRIFDSKKGEDIEALKNGPLLQEYVCVEERMRFTELRKRLSEEEGMEYIVDDNLVRGLDYYTSTAFEFVSNEDSVRAVCAGGRYADLHGINGVGFAAGLERLEGGSCDAEEKEVLLRELEHGVAVLPIAKDADSGESEIGRLCRRIARDVRMKDIRCVVKLDGGRLGKQISRAIRAGAKAVVVVGEDDVCKGLVKVKLVEEGENRDKEFAQHDVRIESVAEFLQSELSSARFQVEGNVDSKEVSKMDCTNL